MNARGYTLTELLVVLAVMGLLAAVAVPVLSQSKPGMEAKAVARLLAADVAAARQDAVNRGVETRFAVRRTFVKGVSVEVERPVVFYPDGSSSGGALAVTDGGVTHRVIVRWPGGQVSVQ